MATKQGTSSVFGVVALCLAASSLVLVVWPSGGAAAFSLLVYGQREFPADFSPDAVSYIHLVHAVLGAVMAGWFVTMAAVARVGRRQPTLAIALGAGLGVWFVPDTIYSIVSGFWENAILNCAVAVLLALPLARLWRRSRELTAGGPAAPEG